MGVLSGRQILAKGDITVSEQPLYSPISCDIFFLFRKFTKTARFEDSVAIKRAVTMVLKGIPEESFRQCSREGWESAFDSR